MNLYSKCYRDLMMKESHASSIKVVVEKSFTFRAPGNKVIVFTSEIVSQSQKGVSSHIVGPSSSQFVEDLYPVWLSAETLKRYFSCHKWVSLIRFKCW
eukprot:Gb_01651 [translate_table: standard]